MNTRTSIVAFTPHPMAILAFQSLNDTFEPKRIPLADGQHVLIARQCEEQDYPTEENGRFNNGTLSRQHAEVWEEGGKVRVGVMRMHGLRLVA